MGITENKPKFSDDPFPIVYNGSTYGIQLPWKESHPFFEDNYQLPKQKLFYQTKRLKRDHDLLSNYSDVMWEQEEAGILEKVPE